MGGQARPGRGSQEHAHRPLRSPLDPHPRGFGRIFQGRDCCLPSPTQGMLSADDTQGPPEHTGRHPGAVWESRGRQLGPTGRNLDVRTNQTSLLSAASLAHDYRGLSSCACAAARPLTLTPESTGTRPRGESGTESREAQAPQFSKHSRLKDPVWVGGIPRWLFWLNQTRKLCSLQNTRTVRP